MEDYYQRFVKLADKKGAVYDNDLEALIWIEEKIDDYYTLDYLNVMAGSAKIASANVRLSSKIEIFEAAAIGHGPVEAAYKAIDQISQKSLKLIDYKISSQGSGRDALGQVNVVVLYHEKRYHGVAFSTDIVEASAKAYLNALNAVMVFDTIAHKSNHQAAIPHAELTAEA